MCCFMDFGRDSVSCDNAFGSCNIPNFYQNMEQKKIVLFLLIEKSQGIKNFLSIIKCFFLRFY
jgi:hypothetical protein